MVPQGAVLVQASELKQRTPRTDKAIHQTGRKGRGDRNQNLQSLAINGREPLGSARLRGGLAACYSSFVARAASTWAMPSLAPQSPSEAPRVGIQPHITRTLHSLLQ